MARLVNSHAFISGLMMHPSFNEPKALDFLLDTGCTITTILPKEVLRLEIDYNNIPESSQRAETVTSKIKTRRLENPTLFFRYNDAETAQIRIKDFPLDFVDIIPPEKKNLIVRIFDWINTNVFNVPSDSMPYTDNLLGMNFLKQFKYWTFTDRELILDTEIP